MIPWSTTIIQSKAAAATATDRPASDESSRQPADLFSTFSIVFSLAGLFVLAPSRCSDAFTPAATGAAATTPLMSVTAMTTATLAPVGRAAVDVDELAAVAGDTAARDAT